MEASLPSDGGQGVVAVGEVVGAVYPYSGCFGVLVNLGVYFWVAGGGEGEPVGGHLAALVGALVPPQVGVVGYGGYGVGCYHGEGGARLEEFGCFAGGYWPGAD